jgi:signal transduction histidine kinase
VDAWLTRRYERYRGSYLRASIWTVYVLGLLTAALAGGMGCRVEGLPLGKTLLAVGTQVLLTLATLPILELMLRPDTRPLLRWASGDRSSTLDAQQARSASLELPRSLFRAGLRVNIVMAATLGPLPILIFDHNLVLLDYLVLAAGGALATTQWLSSSYFALDLAMHPIAQETGKAIGDYRPARQVTPLSTKLLLGIMGSTLLTGIFVGACVTDAGVGATGLLKIYGIGIVGATLIGFASVVLILLTVLGPVRELTTGTRWVATGGFGWRVPVVSTDELGELAGSFNRMAEQLGTRTEELRASRARIVASSDETRRKVERDLHDGAQQHLVLLDLKLGLAKKLVSDDSRGVAALEEAQADLERALSELRDLAHGIYPSVLTNNGLASALEEAATRAPLPVEVEIEVEGDRRYRPELEAAIYFCCLEALQNAGKHAGEGARATVRLSPAGFELKFEVQDDGRGFDAASVNGRAGLQNMDDRIGALGGEVRIESEPGEGTVVAGSVPIGVRV